MSEQCESCSRWVPEDRIHHDIEGVGLCPGCWEKEPKYTADDYEYPPLDGE